MKLRNTICFLPIEIKNRELDTKIFLAKCLADRGFQVVVGRKAGINKIMFANKKPFVYFCKGISPSQLSFYKAIKASNGLMAEIQEEGNVSQNTKTLIRVHNNLSAELFSLIFTWGKFATKTIKQNCPNLNSSQIVCTGHPAFDLLHKDYIKYYKNLRILSHKIKKDYILINTNFTSANGILTFEQSRIVNNFAKDIHNKKTKKKQEQNSKYEKQTFLEFVKLINTLSKSFKGKIFVVRPHPTEKIEIYRKIFKDQKNIIVSKEGSSKEWIEGAKCVIHNDCTTGIEAYIANKNVISFCPLIDGNEKFISELPRSISIKLDSISEIVKYIKRGYKLEKTEDRKLKLNKAKILKKYIANLDQKATYKIISSVEKLFNNFNANENYFIKKKYYLMQTYFLSFIKLIKRKLLGSKNDHEYLKSIANFKFKSLKRKEILVRLDIWKKILKRKESYTVTEMQPDTFLIKLK